MSVRFDFLLKLSISTFNYKPKLSLSINFEFAKINFSKVGLGELVLAIH